MNNDTDKGKTTYIRIFSNPVQTEPTLEKLYSACIELALCYQAVDQLDVLKCSQET